MTKWKILPCDLESLATPLIKLFEVGLITKDEARSWLFESASPTQEDSNPPLDEGQGSGILVIHL